MSSSMLKLNSEKSEFIILESHVQLKKFDSHFSVGIFGKLLHPSAVVKSLGVWFDAIFFFAGHGPTICKAFFIQMHDLRLVRQYLTVDAAVLAANATIFSEVYPVSTCVNCSVHKIHAGGSSQIAVDTHGLVLFSKTPWLPVAFFFFFIQIFFLFTKQYIQV